MIDEYISYQRGGQEVAVRADALGTQRILERAGFVRVEPSQEVIQVVEWPDEMSRHLIKALQAHDITTPEDARRASDEDLLAVAGIGPATVRKIREALGDDV